MVKTGYEAMMNWKGDYIKKVGHRRPNYEALVVLWSLKACELMAFFLLSCVKVVFFMLIMVYRFKVA
jgi:hypothetical protein